MLIYNTKKMKLILGISLFLPTYFKRLWIFDFETNYKLHPTTCCIITGLFISLKKHCQNVSEKEPIFADEGATVRALLKNKNAEK
jgi:hypothetical protein